METNTLVTHKKLKSLGIGCVAKILRKGKANVNFGLSDVMTCNVNMLDAVDVSNTKTINYDEFRDRIMKDTSKLNECIVGNELMQYVGIGWVTIRPITNDDLVKYPRVIK